jgi:hypothetical protein
MADWELAIQPLNLRLAADVRAGRSSQNDHCWDVTLAQQADQPALTLQTRYGGRVGLARLVPMLGIDGKTIYEKGAFAGEFKLTALAPDFLRLEAEPVAGVKLEFLAWTIASDVLGGMFTLKNLGDEPIQAEVQVFFQAMRENSALKMRLLELATPNGRAVALAMRPLGDISPVLLMESAQETGAAKLSTSLELEPGAEQSVRFVHAALADEDASLLTAHAWLYEAKWRAFLDASAARLDRLPVVDTADDEFDAAVALSVNALLHGLVDDGSKYPKPVMLRGPGSPIRTDAPALDVFQYAASLAVLEPELAAGILRNYIATQQSDGWISDPDDELLLPMLGQLAQIITGYLGDDAFQQEISSGLKKFHARWLAGDDLPRWSSVTQANAPYHPTFSMTARGAIPADITLADCPDLFTYLVNEGENLSGPLLDLWDADSGRFVYHDRDAKTPLIGQQLFTGRGDQSLAEPVTLQAPNRIILQVEGGASHQPTLTARIAGVDAGGHPKKEILENAQFKWYRGAGVATSQNLWSTLDSVTLDGLSRVYGYTVRTVDLSRHDITLMLPLTTGALDDHQVKAMLRQLEADYWRTYGLASLPHTDADYHHPDSNGRHVSPVWNTMIGLALLNLGEGKASAELFDRVAAAQTKTLKQQGAFFQWYHAEDGSGLGAPQHVTGVISLHWLIQLLGVYVHDGGTVEILGAFNYPRAVKITWHGVRLARTKNTLKVKFPSGLTHEFKSDVAPQIVRDPDFSPQTITEPKSLPGQKKKQAGRVNIPVESDIPLDDDGLWGAPD